jgi:hypothetical protein
MTTDEFEIQISDRYVTVQNSGKFNTPVMTRQSPMMTKPPAHRVVFDGGSVARISLQSKEPEIGSDELSQSSELSPSYRFT